MHNMWSEFQSEGQRFELCAIEERIFFVKIVQWNDSFVTILKHKIKQFYHIETESVLSSVQLSSHSFINVDKNVMISIQGQRIEINQFILITKVVRVLIKKCLHWYIPFILLILKQFFKTIYVNKEWYCNWCRTSYEYKMPSDEQRDIRFAAETLYRYAQRPPLVLCKILPSLMSIYWN